MVGVAAVVAAGVVVAAIHGYSGVNWGPMLSGSWSVRIHALHHELRRWGWKGPILLILLIGLHSIFFLLPIEVPMIVALGLYGPVWGVLYSWIGSMLAAFVGYALARTVGRSLLKNRLPQGILDQVNSRVTRFGGLGLLLLRFIPLVSFNALNYACGLTSVSLWSFAWTAALGILITDSFTAFLYRGAVNAAWGSVILMLVAAVLILGAMWRWQHRIFPMKHEDRG